jgi:hypothetical protein
MVKRAQSREIAAPALQIDKILYYLLNPDPFQDLVNAFPADHVAAKLSSLVDLMELSNYSLVETI